MISMKPKKTAKRKPQSKPAAQAESAKHALPVPRAAVSLNRADDALRRLGVRPEVLAQAPPITPILRRTAGGMKRALEALRISEDELVTTFFEKYDSIPVGDRGVVPIEAVLLAAGINIRNFLGAAQLALHEHASNLTKHIIVTAQPDIAEARVRYGLMASGEKDRTALQQAVGVLPSPKGPTFIGKAIFGSGQNVMNDQRTLPAGRDDQDDDDDDNTPMDPDIIDLDKLFPPAIRMQEKLTAIRQRQLPAGKETPASHWTPDDREHVRLARKCAMEPDHMTSEEWAAWERLEKTNTVFKDNGGHR
jgi:hypothetical protein